ncbi:MAG: DHH family phosphoesterase [Angelakisella sp.]
MEITTAQAAAELLAQDNITILCHRKPDGDTLGSGFALHHALTQLGKRSAVRCADTYPPNMKQYMLPDTFTASSEDYVVAVDVADIKLLGALEAEYTGRVNLNIDHHPSNKFFAEKTVLCPQAAATAELITDLLMEMNAELTLPIATCLYVGLCTDTGCFRYSNTTADTLRKAALMLEKGVDNGEINHALFESKSAGRVAIECITQQSMEYFYDGHLAIMTIPKALQEGNNVDDSELDGLSALPRQIEGVWIGVTVRENEGECRVSVRTTKEADSAAISAIFGGGGHLRAGGCTISGSVEQAKKRLVEEIGKYLCRVE